MNLYWSGPLEGHIRNFISGVCVCGGPGLPLWGGCQVFHNIASLKPLFTVPSSPRQTNDCGYHFINIYKSYYKNCKYNTNTNTIYMSTKSMCI